MIRNKNNVSFLTVTHTNHRISYMQDLDMVPAAPCPAVLMFQLLSVSARLHYLCRVCFERWIKCGLPGTPPERASGVALLVIAFAVGKWCGKWCFATVLHYRPLHLEKPVCSPPSDRDTAKENRRRENVGRRVVCRSLFWHPGVLPHYSPLQGRSARWHERTKTHTHLLSDTAAVTQQVSFVIKPCVCCRFWVDRWHI